MDKFKLEYRPKNLVDSFNRLKRVNEFTLIPLFDTVIDRFVAKVKKNPQMYGVTDIEKIKHTSGLWSSAGTEYNLVVDGRIISLRIYYTDIKPCEEFGDEDEFFYMQSSILFSGQKEAKDAVEKIFEKFRIFVGEQDLIELITCATEKLKGQHITSSASKFYFDPYFRKAMLDEQILMHF